ncbi:unnamed protein product [Gadus morhua 'NCC']
MEQKDAQTDALMTSATDSRLHSCSPPASSQWEPPLPIHGLIIGSQPHSVQTVFGPVAEACPGGSMGVTAPLRRQSTPVPGTPAEPPWPDDVITKADGIIRQHFGLGRRSFEHTELNTEEEKSWTQRRRRAEHRGGEELNTEKEKS